MRKPVILAISGGILAAIVLLSACSATVPIPRLINCSGKVVTQEMSFTDFSSLEIGSVFEVEITESGSYLIAITADDNLFEYIKVFQEGETLKIHLTPTYNYSGVTLKAKISMPRLSGLHLYGATKGTIRGFQSSNDLDLQLSGASHLNMDMEAGDVRFEVSEAAGVIGALRASNTELNVSAASKVELEGSASKMLLSASGASKIMLANFSLDQADVTLSGASEATIKVGGRLDVILSGASRLYYKGSPMIGDITVSDTSAIKRK